LWVERPDGSGRHRLATGGTSGSSADWVEGSGWDWSPDSTRIAVVEPDPGRNSENDDPERLAIVDAASARVSARVPLSLGEPAAWDGWAWSPDGARIAYFGPTGALRVLDARSGAVVARAPVARGD